MKPFMIKGSDLRPRDVRTAAPPSNKKGKAPAPPAKAPPKPKGGSTAKQAKEPAPTPKEVSVGVDLGTTNSAIAILGPDAKPVTVPVDPRGRTTVPSVVHVGEGGAVAVGRTARAKGSSDPLNTFYSVKRLIGKPYDRAVEEGVGALVPYQMVRGEGGLAALACRHVEGGVLLPEQVSGLVLEELLEAVKRHTKAGISKAVISVPAYFNEAQRERTKAAGALAGIDRIRLLREPVAAALAYGLDAREDRTVLVFDLGGGTLDVSILEVGGGTIEVLATGGDAFLGGDDFDCALAEHLGREVLEPAGVRGWRADPVLWGSLRAVAERAKVELSTAPRVALSLPVGPGGRPLEAVVTREAFEGAAADLYRRMRLPLDQACWQAGIELGAPSPTSGRTKSMGEAELQAERLTPRREFDFRSTRRTPITDIIMVGGATRMPGVRRFLKNMTGIEPRDYPVDPDEAVALGAAVQAGILDGTLSDLVVMDVFQAAMMRAFAAKALKEKGGAVGPGGRTVFGDEDEDSDDDEEWGPEDLSELMLMGEGAQAQQGAAADLQGAAPIASSIQGAEPAATGSQGAPSSVPAAGSTSGSSAS